MILLSPGNESHNKGEKIPLIQLPMSEGGEEYSLEDFQWWSKSKDFQEWLKKNPREWTAESLENNYDSVEILNERKNFSFLKTYQSFINEAEGSEDIDEETAKRMIKFNYAYNRLIEAGKLEEVFNSSEMSSGDKKALFLNIIYDENDKEGVSGTLQAYRSKFMKTGSDQFNIVEFDYSLPLDEELGDTNMPDLIDKVFKYSETGILTLGAVGIIGIIGLKGAHFLFSRWIWKKGIGLSSFLRRAETVSETAARIARLEKKAERLAIAGRTLKSGLLTIKDMALLKQTRGGLSAVIKATKVRNVKAVGLLRAFVRGSGLEKVFPKFLGKTAAKVGGKGLGKLVPFVGEVLMVVDAAYSLWSWNKGSQAPKYSEVEDFANGEFIPSKVEVGIPITICWSQPSGSFMNWVATDETRTTMELIKVGEQNGKVFFILTQANSEGLQKTLSDNALVMLSFNEDDKFVRHWYDNNDIDFDLILIKEISSLISPFLYQGHSEWDDFKNLYDDAEDYLLKAPDNAPGEFEFYFEDANKDIINTTGDLLSTEEINSLPDETIEKIFGYSDGTSVEESNSLKYSEGIDLSIHTRISDFLKEASNDDSENETEELTPKQQSNPTPIGIYRHNKASYANPAIEKEKKIRDLGYYLVFPESLEAEDGDPVLLFSAEIEFTNATKGVYVYKEPEKETDNSKSDSENNKGKTGDEDNEGNNKSNKDKEPVITASPKDVSYKEKTNSIVIKDKPVKDGINIMDEFLSNDDRITLQIKDWKNINTIRVKKRGRIIYKVTLYNTEIGHESGIKEYTRVDGKAFEIAKRLVNSVKNDIKYY